MRLPDFDEDYIALFLLAFLLVVWVSSLWQGLEALNLAADISKFAIGAIAGYWGSKKTG